MSFSIFYPCCHPPHYRLHLHSVRKRAKQRKGGRAEEACCSLWQPSPKSQAISIRIVARQSAVSHEWACHWRLCWVGIIYHGCHCMLTRPQLLSAGGKHHMCLIWTTWSLSQPVEISPWRITVLCGRTGFGLSEKIGREIRSVPKPSELPCCLFPAAYIDSCRNNFLWVIRKALGTPFNWF